MPGGPRRSREDTGGPLSVSFSTCLLKSETTVSCAHMKLCDLHRPFNVGRPNHRTVSFVHMKLCDLHRSGNVGRPNCGTASSVHMKLCDLNGFFNVGLPNR